MKLSAAPHPIAPAISSEPPVCFHHKVSGEEFVRIYLLYPVQQDRVELALGPQQHCSNASPPCGEKFDLLYLQPLVQEDPAGPAPGLRQHYPCALPHCAGEYPHRGQLTIRSEDSRLSRIACQKTRNLLLTRASSDTFDHFFSSCWIRRIPDTAPIQSKILHRHHR